MAKKQKRSVSSANRSAAAPRPAVANGASTPTERPAAATATRSSYIQEFKPDYTHVITDLKKIGILAASFITVLVVISFFLR
jgi:hypothetical protein